MPFLRAINVFILFSELHGRDELAASTKISNPGCYATSTQLLIAPLLPYLDLHIPPTVFGVSGYSGAGTKAGAKSGDGRPTTLPKVSPEDLSGGIKPYSLTDHIHEREAARHLSRLLSNGATIQPAFIPTIAPWFSGIISVLSAPLKLQMDARNVRQLYEERYEGEKLLTVQNTVPVLQEIEGHHGWRVGGFQVHSSGKRAVVVVSELFTLKRHKITLHKIQGGLDNLLKGAATQCIQVRDIEFSFCLWTQSFDRILTLHLDLESMLVYRVDRIHDFCIYLVARAATLHYCVQHFGRHACPINYIGVRQGTNQDHIS